MTNPTNKSLVIKLGSEIFRHNGGVHEEVFGIVAGQVSALMQQGTLVTIVSSFAIRLGQIWLDKQGFTTYRKLQGAVQRAALAGVGQPKLMGYWDAAFLKEGIAAGQVLLSDASLMHREDWSNTGKVIAAYHDIGVVPIVNANDTVSWAEAQRYEVKTSDNDFVTSQLVPHTDATDVLIGTKVGGVYHPNHLHPNARLYAEISYQNPPLVEACPETDSNNGMGPKINHAIICYGEGKRRVAIGRYDAIFRFGNGEEVPTMIGTQNRLSA